MGFAASVISVVLKSVVGEKLGDGLVKELTDITIDGISEKGVNDIRNFINEGKAKIENILSEEKMKLMKVPDENIAYVSAEIRNLLSRIDITDEVLRKCRYSEGELQDFMWNVYVSWKGSYIIECEGNIKTCLFAVASALLKLARESDEFRDQMLIQISNSVDDIKAAFKDGVLHLTFPKEIQKQEEQPRLITIE